MAPAHCSCFRAPYVQARKRASTNQLRNTSFQRRKHRNVKLGDQQFLLAIMERSTRLQLASIASVICVVAVAASDGAATTVRRAQV